MGLLAQLQFTTVPQGTEFPGTVQALGELLAQYFEITGLDTFNGINFGATTPAEADRDKPWFQTDGSGNPIGWRSWNGSAWEPIPFVVPSGATEDRPVGAVAGQLFFDTTINVMLIYERSQWRTQAGSPGDIKEVKAATLAEALAKNPGWSDDTDSAGMVIASPSGGHAYGDSVGSETPTLSP